MEELPADVSACRRTPEYTERTVPPGLERVHDTRAGVWGRLVVVEGGLRYRIYGPEDARGEGPCEEHWLTPGVDGVIAPQVPHTVLFEGPVRFYVEFLR